MLREIEFYERDIMRKFGGYKPYHHRIDVKPVPEGVNYINETWIVDATAYSIPEAKFNPEDCVDGSGDNIRIYVPLDINKAAILRRLDRIISSFGETNEDNEVDFEIAVERLLWQVEIYDQIFAARNGKSGHSDEATELMKEIVGRLEDIPDGCAEVFPFELIDELRAEYGI